MPKFDSFTSFFDRVTYRGGIKYIDDMHYLVFYSSTSNKFGFRPLFPFAALYHIDTPIKAHEMYDKSGKYYTMQPIKYIPLVAKKYRDPFFSHIDTFPATNDITPQAIDTSVQAHLLVTGQYQNNGILVYQYDPVKQDLKKVWSPTIDYHPRFGG